MTPTTPTLPDMRRSIASHEAGHAVVALVLVNRLVSVEINGPDDGWTRTGVDSGTAFDILTFQYAGQFGEMLVMDDDTQYWPMSWTGDRARIDQIIEQERWKRIEGGMDAAVASSSVECMRRQAKALARWIVANHERALHAIADTLFVRGRLEGDEVREIFRANPPTQEVTKEPNSGRCRCQPLKPTRSAPRHRSSLEATTPGGPRT
jgi:hypothetical protein